MPTSVEVFDVELSNVKVAPGPVGILAYSVYTVTV